MATCHRFALLLVGLLAFTHHTPINVAASEAGSIATRLLTEITREDGSLATALAKGREPLNFTNLLVEARASVTSGTAPRTLALLDALEDAYMRTSLLCTNDAYLKVRLLVCPNAMHPTMLQVTRMFMVQYNGSAGSNTLPQLPVLLLNSSSSSGAGFGGSGGGGRLPVQGGVGPGGAAGPGMAMGAPPANVSVRIAVETVVVTGLPKTQADLDWLSIVPPLEKDDGFVGRVAPTDEAMALYPELVLWLRDRNTSRLDDYEAQGGELPKMPNSDVADPGPTTWFMLYYRRDWLPYAVQAARESHGSSGSGQGPTHPAGEGAGVGVAGQVHGIEDAGEKEAGTWLLPGTWQDLVSLAGAVEGRDMDGDGTPDHGLCLDLAGGCKLWALLAAVHVSLAQTRGQAQGAWFDRWTMEPLVDSPAMREALAVVRQLAASSYPPANWTRLTDRGEPLDDVAWFVTDYNDGEGCPAVNPLFAQGRCLFTLDWAHALPFLSAAMAPALAGRLGLGLAPGSARVWAQPAFARKAINLDAWLTATRFDASGPPPGVKPGPSAPAAGAGMGRTLRQAGAAEPGGAQQGGGVSSLAGRSDGAGLEACVVGGSCAEPFTQPLNRSFTLLPGGQWVNRAPLRSLARVHLLQGNTRGFTNQQLDALFRLLGQFWYTGFPLYNSLYTFFKRGRQRDRAAAQPLSAAYRLALDEAALAAASKPALSPGDASALAKKLNSDFTFIVTALPFFNISRTIYWSSLKFVPPPEEEPSTPPRPPWAIDVGRVLAAVLVPVLALTLLALVVLLLQHRRRNYLSLLTGRALPPRHGPDVTLVATDIQNSTLLWEVLPPDVMNAALSVHHGEVRRALERHGGHEAGTEGDSFLVAFHTAAAALAFCVDLQVSLLNADWPPALLATEDGCEVWGTPNVQMLQVMEEGSPLPWHHHHRSKRVPSATSPVGPEPGTQPSPGVAGDEAHPTDSLPTDSGSLQHLLKLPHLLWPGATSTTAKALLQKTSRALDPAPSWHRANGSRRPCKTQSGPIPTAALRDVRSQPASPASTIPGAAVRTQLRQPETPTLLTPRLDACSTKETGSGVSSFDADVLKPSPQDAPCTGGGEELPQLGVVLGLPGACIDRQGKAPGMVHLSLSRLGHMECMGEELTASNACRSGHQGQDGAAAGSTREAARLTSSSLPWRQGLVAAAAGAAVAGEHAEVSSQCMRPLEEQAEAQGSNQEQGQGDQQQQQQRRQQGQQRPQGALSNSGPGFGSRGGSWRHAPVEAVAEVSHSQRHSQSQRLEPATALVRDFGRRLGPAPSFEMPPGLDGSAWSRYALPPDTEGHTAYGSQHHDDSAPLHLGNVRQGSWRRHTVGGHTAHGEEEHGRAPADGAEAALNALLAAAGSRRGRGGHLLGALQGMWSWTAEQDDEVAASSKLAEAGGASSLARPVLAHRGLRVRMGVHSGLLPGEVVEAARGCCEYRGDAVARCKAVCDVAAGGVVLATEATHAAFKVSREAARRDMHRPQLLHVGPPRRREGAAAGPGAGAGAVADSAGSARPTPTSALQGCLPAAAATAAAGSQAPALCGDLFCVLDTRLLPRHGFSQPFRPCYDLDPLSTWLAPVGPSLVAAFLYVSGHVVLQAWDEAVLGRALALLHGAVADSVAAAGGYVVAATEGGAVAVFGQAGAAVAWAVACQERLMTLAWPEELLEHDYGEEVRRDGRVVLRGLRVRLGLEAGPAAARLVPRTGRLDYTGRTMNRASRIASKAAQGAVLVSQALWGSCQRQETARPGAGAPPLSAGAACGAAPGRSHGSCTAAGHVAVCGDGDARAAAPMQRSASLPHGQHADAPSWQEQQEQERLQKLRLDAGAAAPRAPLVPVCELVGSSQGPVLLKGVRELVELVQVERGRAGASGGQAHGAS